MRKKRGDSLIISYVLLIVIILGLATLVYAFLKLYPPSKTQECPQDVSLSIEQAVCSVSTGKLTIDIRNTGLFTINAIFVRMALPEREVRPQVNKGSETLPTGFLKPTSITLEQDYTVDFDLSQTSYVVEVQPAIIKNRALVLCKNIATETVTCIA